MANAAELDNFFSGELFGNEQNSINNFSHLLDKKDENLSFLENSSSEHSNVALDFLLDAACDSPVKPLLEHNEGKTSFDVLNSFLLTDEAHQESPLSNLLCQKESGSKIPNDILDHGVFLSVEDVSYDILDQLGSLSISPFPSGDDNDISFRDFLEVNDRTNYTSSREKENNTTSDSFNSPFANLYYSNTSFANDQEKEILEKELLQSDSDYSTGKEKLLNSEVDLSGAKHIAANVEQSNILKIAPRLRKKSSLVKHKPSLFCKVLCSKPKTSGFATVPNLPKNLVGLLEDFHYWDYFTFDTPSPDDIIKESQNYHVYESPVQLQTFD